MRRHARRPGAHVRRARGWKVTSDGAFWGGVLMVGSVGGLLAVIAMAVTARHPAP
ncbi:MULTISPECIES: hypothetical protein [unclassified Streptomyces]|uniref:hypothetical protein n=1 Tax=unclassified Streptomyces TaxID=2593676 RepID=UPI002E1FF96F|nr:hypothetical protein OG217_25330 [Streptomyces sp. NBC_01023]